jgi:hypothetical protein
MRQREMTYQFRKSLKEPQSNIDKNNLTNKRLSDRRSIILTQNSILPSLTRSSKRFSTINKTHLSNIL